MVQERVVTPATTIPPPLLSTQQSLPPTVKSTQDRKNNAATGASAASVRALSARLLTFYFRAPVKAFFRTRVDYLAFARAVNPRVQAGEPWSLKMSTPGLLGHAVRTYGWSFIPNQVLPPLMANVAVGAVLYGSYLQILGSLHGPSGEAVKRIYPPPPVEKTFAAGFAAGAAQSVFAAPVDALQVRFRTEEMLQGRYKNMWQYGHQKLREIGVRGIFAGSGLSMVKDTFGYGVFFATFEYVKAQCFYEFVTKYYGALEADFLGNIRRGPDSDAGTPTIRPHYAMEPTFLLLAGITATVAQQVVQYPLTLIQSIHYGRLEVLGQEAKQCKQSRQMLSNYKKAYGKTFEQCSLQARQCGGMRKWLYRGFLSTTLKQVPSTSAGLIIFELVRRRYAEETDAVRIKKDGYDILLM
jgi:hypothetical protein